MLLLTPEMRHGWLIQLGLYLVANDTWNCTKESTDILLPTYNNVYIYDGT